MQFEPVAKLPAREKSMILTNPYQNPHAGSAGGGDDILEKVDEPPLGQGASKGRFCAAGSFATGSFKRALVTGASSGLGKVLCEKIAAQGIPLIITGRNIEKLEELAHQLGSNPVVEAADLCKKSERQKIINLIHQYAPDLVINNAGFGFYGHTLALTTQEQLEIFEVNVNAVFELTVETARALQAHDQPGTIVNISSAAAFFIYPTFTAYASAKACVNNFSQALDAEFAPLGIRVLTACPGQFATSFRTRAAKGHPQQGSFGTMSVDRVADQILAQIKRGQRLSIIDWRYKILTLLTKLLPQKWLQGALMKSLKKRHHMNMNTG